MRSGQAVKQGALLLALGGWLAAAAAETGPLPALMDNGRGIRRILLLDVYEMALRTTRPMRQAAEVLADPAPQEIQLRMLRDAPADKFIEAIDNGVRENHGDTAETLALLQQLYSALRAAGGAPQGSTAKIVWDGARTSVSLDGRPLLSAPGPLLRNTLLLVWLGEHPVDAQLKNGLLGGS